jgi:DNA (cytosine-5)-methyltransferase 1
LFVGGRALIGRKEWILNLMKTVAEFFAGIGLMRMGLERAGWETVWANDIDPDKLEIYHGHFPASSGHFVLGDVHEISPLEFPDVILATASFPCNDLSLAGARKGLAGTHSSAFWGFIKVLEGLKGRKPPIVLFENVPGFLTSHEGNDFREACLALNRLGYAVDTIMVDAAAFVPQSRQRLFIVGTKGIPLPSLLKETPAFLEGSARPAALADFILWNPDILWSIRELPPLPTRATKLPDIIEDLPHNSSFWWSSERSKYLLEQMSPKHRKMADDMIGGENLSYGTVFRRVRNGRSMAELRTDGTAGCLRTPRGGSGRQILFVGGRGEYRVRLLTPRECARLMGADDYSLSSTLNLNQALFGFGDAVCVSVIEWIATHYLNPLFDELNSLPRYGTRGIARYTA